MRYWWLVVAALTWSACSGKSSDDDTSTSGTTDSSTTGPGGDSGDTDDSGATEDTGGFPQRPDPFTIQVTGSTEVTLAFDSPTCSHRTGSETFRQFWRGSDHVWVLVIEMFNTFPGEAGSYTAADGVRTRLQEEAGGMGGYYDSQFDGAGAALDLEGLDTDANEAWGSAMMGTLGDGSGGFVSVSPDSIPVWCDALE
jgi:hypothetical protein